MSDRISRKTVMQVGVIISTGMTLLIPLAQTGTQLIIIRLLTGIGLGFAISAPFPIAAELMPKQHRRTYGAIFEVMLASAFTLLPFVGFLLAGNPDGFRLIALPGGLALGIVPLLVHFGLPESARWYLRRGNPQAAVATVNRMIERCGDRVPKLTVPELGPNLEDAQTALPPFSALFARGQLQWTVVGIVLYAAATTAYYCSAILLPKALVDQGAAVSLSFGLGTLLFMVTIPGKFFTGFIMEIIGRRWTITYCLGGAVPGLLLMAMAHDAGNLATVVMTAGAIITGLTVLSSFPAVRVYLSEQYPTALRGRGHFFGEATGRVFSGVLTHSSWSPIPDRQRSSSAGSRWWWGSAPASHWCSARRPWGSSSWSPRRARCAPSRSPSTWFDLTSRCSFAAHLAALASSKLRRST